jgi:hypothetical protein
MSSNAHTAGIDRRPEFTPLAQSFGQSLTKNTKTQLERVGFLCFGGCFLWKNSEKTLKKTKKPILLKV